MRAQSFFLAALGLVTSILSACGSDGSAIGGGSDGGDAGTSPSEGGTPVVRCNASGDIPFVWAKRLAAGGSPDAVSLAKDGSMRIGGLFASPPGAPFVLGPGSAHETKLVATLDTPDAWLAKLDANGDLLWAKSAGGTGSDSTTALGAGEDGATVVAGLYAGTAVFDKGLPTETILDGGGSSGMFVARYGSDGALAWVKKATGGKARAGSIFVANDGSLRVWGTLSGTVTFGAGEPTQTMLTSAFENGDYFLAKYGSDGALAWAKRITRIAAAHVAMTADGSVSLVATANGSNTTTLAIGEANETVVADTELFFARFDADGKLLSVISQSGEPATDVALATDGSFTVVGTLFPPGDPDQSVTFGKGASNETTFDHGQPDFFLARFDADGAFSWVKRSNDGVGKELGRLVGLAPDGSARVMGTYSAASSPMLGEGELGAVKLPLTPCSGTACDIPFLASFAPDGAVRAAKRLARVPPAVTDLFVLEDGSFRIIGRAPRETIFGEGEPGATTLEGMFVAHYGACP